MPKTLKRPRKTIVLAPDPPTAESTLGEDVEPVIVPFMPSIAATLGPNCPGAAAAIRAISVVGLKPVEIDEIVARLTGGAQ